MTKPANHTLPPPPSLTHQFPVLCAPQHLYLLLPPSPHPLQNYLNITHLLPLFPPTNYSHTHSLSHTYIRAATQLKLTHTNRPNEVLREGSKKRKEWKEEGKKWIGWHGIGFDIVDHSLHRQTDRQEAGNSLSEANQICRSNRMKISSSMGGGGGRRSKQIRNMIAVLPCGECRKLHNGKTRQRAGSVWKGLWWAWSPSSWRHRRLWSQTPPRSLSRDPAW